MNITIRELRQSDIETCDAINRSLPAWFGLESGLEEARGYLHQHHGLVAERNQEVIGYLTWISPFPESAEITWMAVDPGYHRLGIGRALVDTLKTRLLLRGVAMMAVKTLAETHPSPEYAQTRAFYSKQGFQSLMVLPELWDESNPCLIMVCPLIR